MAKVIKAACGVPRLSPGHFIPEPRLPSQCHAVVSISVLFLSCTFYRKMLHTAAALIEGVCSLPHDPMTILQLVPRQRPRRFSLTPSAQLTESPLTTLTSFPVCLLCYPTTWYQHSFILPPCFLWLLCSPTPL